jgi:DNA-binding YbaB/EbfC family protein
MNIQELMKQAQSMQANMEKIERELATKGTTVNIQGLELTMNGKFELTSVSIDPELLIPTNKEIIEDLLSMTINQLTKQIQSEREETMRTLTLGLKIPGVM